MTDSIPKPEWEEIPLNDKPEQYNDEPLRILKEELEKKIFPWISVRYAEKERIRALFVQEKKFRNKKLSGSDDSMWVRFAMMDDARMWVPYFPGEEGNYGPRSVMTLLDFIEYMRDRPIVGIISSEVEDGSDFLVPYSIDEITEDEMVTMSYITNAMEQRCLEILSQRMKSPKLEKDTTDKNVKKN